MGTTSNQKKKSTQKLKMSSNFKKTPEKKSKMDLQKDTKKMSSNFLLEVMKPSDEEQEYRKEKLKKCDDLQKYSKLFQCTKCQKSFENILKKHEKVPIHPCLGVLMCQKCCNYYEDGEFSLDTDGEDKYCRWCGEGGTIFGCSKCIYGFCANCIKRHFKAEYLKKVQKDDNWLCFFCEPKPLWDLRFICSLAIEISKNQRTLNLGSTSKQIEKNSTNCSIENSEQSLSLQNSDLNSHSVNIMKISRKRILSSSSDESENEKPGAYKKNFKQARNSSKSISKKNENKQFENVKTNVLKELEKILKLSEYQMSFGVSWSTKMLEKLLDHDKITSIKGLANECQKIKSFLSILSTYLVQFCNSIDILEKNLLTEKELKIPLEFQDNEKSSYITILQFLGFVNNQVKTFMEKGISLNDILEAEVYNDDNIIGIKKKVNSGKTTFNRNLNIKAASSKRFKSDECGQNDSESKEDTEEQKGEDDDRSRDENGLEIVLDYSSDMVCTEGDDEYKTLNCSNSTIEEANLKKSESKEDIQKILAILENA